MMLTVHEIHALKNDLTKTLEYYLYLIELQAVKAHGYSHNIDV